MVDATTVTDTVTPTVIATATSITALKPNRTTARMYGQPGLKEASTVAELFREEGQV